MHMTSGNGDKESVSQCRSELEPSGGQQKVC